MDIQSFSSLINEDFVVRSEDPEKISFKLIEVGSLNTHRPKKSSTPVRDEPFSLLFVGPSSPVFSQQVFPLNHSQLGDTDIFLVPIGESDDGVEYEAVFT